MATALADRHSGNSAGWGAQHDTEENEPGNVAELELGSDMVSDVHVRSVVEELAPKRLLDDEKTALATQAIKYRYLTFDTPLPLPNTLPLRLLTEVKEPAPPLPPQPDLTAYADPHTWPEKRKRLLLFLSSSATFLTAYTAGAFSPPVPRMAMAFHVSKEMIILAGISIFCFGFALMPMLLAPLSEFNGRYPVFLISGVVYVIFQVVCGAAPNLAAMLIARLFVGCSSSVFSTMVGGVISDMWYAGNRNTPMALFSSAVIMGTGAGPLVAAVITYRTTNPYDKKDDPYDAGLRAPWRWVFWHQSILLGVLMFFLLLFFKESRGSVLLSRKARALNKWYEELEQAGYFGVWLVKNDEVPDKADHPTTNTDEEKDVDGLVRRLHRIRWKVKEDEGRTTVLHLMAVSVYRPFHMFFTEPVVFFFSLWIAFAWAILYLMFGVLVLIFQTVYGWSLEEAGYAFSPMLIGAFVASVLGVYQDKVLFRVIPDRWRTWLRPDVPEARLYAACLLSPLMPAGLFVTGLTARSNIHWVVPMIGVGLSTVGIYSIYLATFNYLADVYNLYASSALAAQGCCRNVMGGVFPLVSRALFVNLGNGRAGSLLGGVGAGLTLVPWVLVFFGDQVRRRSKFAMSLGRP